MQFEVIWMLPGQMNSSQNISREPDEIKMEMERGKCVIASATSILKAENDDEDSKGTISAIVRTV